MKPKIIKDILSQEDIRSLSHIIGKELETRPHVSYEYPRQDRNVDFSVAYYSGYGRIDMKHFAISKDIVKKLTQLVIDNLDSTYTNINYDFVMYAEYSGTSGGKPKLEPHFDVSDRTTIILDYQLRSNRDWGIDVDSEIFVLEDNSGLLFDPLEKIHSRPIVDFEKDDFVKMLFFRFNSDKPVKEKTQDQLDRLDQSRDLYSRGLTEQKVREDDRLRDGV